MDVRLDGSPLSAEELWSSQCGHQVLGHRPDWGTSPPDCPFQTMTSYRSPAASELLPLTDDEGRSSSA